MRDIRTLVSVQAKRKESRSEQKSGQHSPKKRRKFGAVRQFVRKRGTTLYFDAVGDVHKGSEAMQRAQIDQKMVESRMNRPAATNQQPRDVSDPDTMVLQDLYPFVPECVVQQYRSKGVTTVYEWQKQCLALAGVLYPRLEDHGLFRNLVYTAPTSGGKSLVAEMVIMHRLESYKKRCSKKAMIVLPYVALVVEKARDLQAKWLPAGYCVMPMHGRSRGRSVRFEDDVDVIICTIEKANAVVNRLYQERRLSELCAVIVDEVHMIQQDQRRGPILELLLTKLMWARQRNDIQLVCMSATLSNVDQLASWLDAAYCEAESRPVELKEYVCVDERPHEKTHLIANGVDQSSNDRTTAVELCMSGVRENMSILVFCAKRAACESMVETLAYQFTVDNVAEPSEQLRQQRRALRASLAHCCDGNLDAAFTKGVVHGIAYHHAGLMTSERELVENAFRTGVLKILVATSTLATGVNLPAQRVVFVTPRVGRGFIGPLQYMQMSGRAGRTGYGAVGESYLMCTSDELKELSASLFNAALPPLSSRFAVGNEISASSQLLDHDEVERAILETIVCGIAQTHETLVEFMSTTLYARLNITNELQASFSDEIKTIMGGLVKKELLDAVANANNDGGVEYRATKLGVAVCASGIRPINDALRVFRDLEKADKALVVGSELHMCYLVAPLTKSSVLKDQDARSQFLHRLLQLGTEALSKTCSAVGMDLRCIVNALHGFTGNDDRITLRRLVRAFILRDIVAEKSFVKIAKKYGIKRVDVQQLQTDACMYSGMVRIFCESLNWDRLALLIDHIGIRIAMDVHDDLTELTRVPGLKADRARALYDNGIRTIDRLASATTNEIRRILVAALPYGDERATKCGDDAVGLIENARKTIENEREVRIGTK